MARTCQLLRPHRQRRPGPYLALALWGTYHTRPSDHPNHLRSLIIRTSPTPVLLFIFNNYYHGVLSWARRARSTRLMGAAGQPVDGASPRTARLSPSAILVVLGHLMDKRAMRPRLSTRSHFLPYFYASTGGGLHSSSHHQPVVVLAWQDLEHVTHSDTILTPTVRRELTYCHSGASDRRGSSPHLMPGAA